MTRKNDSGLNNQLKLKSHLNLRLKIHHTIQEKGAACNVESYLELVPQLLLQQLAQDRSVLAQSGEKTQKARDHYQQYVGEWLRVGLSH